MNVFRIRGAFVLIVYGRRALNGSVRLLSARAVMLAVFMVTTCGEREIELQGMSSVNHQTSTTGLLAQGVLRAARREPSDSPVSSDRATLLEFYSYFHRNA